MRHFAPVLAFLMLAACHGPQTGPITVMPKYFPHDETKLPPPPLCAAPFQLHVEDVRSSPGVVGRRYEQDRPSLEWPITAQGNVRDYVQKTLEKAFQGKAGDWTGPGRAVVNVTLRKAFVDEKTFYNSEFKGQMNFDVSVSPAGAQQPCWSGSINGLSSNYGKSGNEENYQETLNWALDDATMKLLETKEFTDALCGRCGPSTPPAR